jgi:hypothetical protein
MTMILDAALSRLRDADPAEATPVDTLGTDPYAHAMLTQILGSADDHSLAEPNRTRRRRRIRRRALAGAVVAAVVVTAVAAVVPMPWSHGQMSSAAYAVTKNADGTVAVTVRWNQLRDPDALNAQLRQAGVRAAVLLYSPPGQCRTPVPADPAYSTLRLDMRQHPELANDPLALAIYLRSLTPWIAHPQQSGEPEDVSVFTIHPDAIPSGDQLLILPQWHRNEGATTNDMLELRSLIVPALPQCVPSPADSVMTRNGIEPR